VPLISESRGPTSSQPEFHAIRHKPGGLVPVLAQSLINHHRRVVGAPQHSLKHIADATVPFGFRLFALAVHSRHPQGDPPPGGGAGPSYQSL